MGEDTGIGGADIRLEAAVKLPDLRPVRVQRLDVSVTNTRPELRLLQCHADRTHRRLRSQSRHGVDGDVDNISTGLGGCNHACRRDTSCVVRVDVDRKARVLLANRANKPEELWSVGNV